MLNYFPKDVNGDDFSTDEEAVDHQKSIFDYDRTPASRQTPKDDKKFKRARTVEDPDGDYNPKSKPVEKRGRKRKKRTKKRNETPPKKRRSNEDEWID